LTACEAGQIRGPAISKTTTATIAHVAQRGIPDFSPSFFGPVELGVLLFEFLPELKPTNEPNLFLDFFCDGFGRFEEDGFDGGGGGGSLVTELMIRPACITEHSQVFNRQLDSRRVSCCVSQCVGKLAAVR
jgi:hypothetical protein